MTKGDVFLDDDMSSDAIKAQLAATERVAKHKGYAIAIGHPHENTLAALEEWIPEAEKDGFEFVPVKESGEFEENNQELAK